MVRYYKALVLCVRIGNRRMWKIAVVKRVIAVTAILLILISGSVGCVPSKVQEITFERLFLDPDQFNGKDIVIEGYYYQGFETIVLSEKLDYSNYAPGHLNPKGGMLWIEGGVPKEVYDNAHQQQMMGPLERYAKVRIIGQFEYGGEYGHLGQYEYQIVPSEVNSLVWSPLPPIGIEELKVHFIDVGQGDSILIDLGRTEILIDGGGRSSGVVSYLKSYVDKPIEVMVATHPHADHIGGLISVLDEFVVEEIWLNGDTATTKTYEDFMAAVQSENAEVNTAKLHDTIEVGELSLFVHHPSRTFDSINNNSIVLHLAHKDIDFLFTGDAEKEAEGAMMALSSVRIPEVEILKLGHHGSRTASFKDFLAITNPEVAIYMAGLDNTYGHPHEEPTKALKEMGAQIYGTDVSGNIIVVSNGESYSVTTEK
jgi:beta-lactamase superfamily II metal-dependent hydrolase